jgi:hypothetical protein
MKSKRQMFMEGYENGICDAQQILMRARLWPLNRMNTHELLIKLDLEMDSLRNHSEENE